MRPVGLQNLAIAGDLRFKLRFVLIDQATEERPTPDPLVPEIGNGSFRAWRAQLQRSMRPLSVVVPCILKRALRRGVLSEDRHAAR
jgi:hypothetical protein